MHRQGGTAIVIDRRCCARHDSDPHLPNETHSGREFVHGVVAALEVHPQLLCSAPVIWQHSACVTERIGPDDALSSSQVTT